MKVLCATLLVIIPTVCFAQCKTATATLKVKIGAAESNKRLFVKKLDEHGCKHGLVVEQVDEGFDYRISLSDVRKERPTFSMAGVGTAYTNIVLTIVYDDKETMLFQVERGDRLTHAGAVNASAKEIVKRLIRAHQEAMEKRHHCPPQAETRCAKPERRPGFCAALLPTRSWLSRLRSEFRAPTVKRWRK